VGHATRLSRNVGRSVSNLYFVNTLGAALGCFLVAGLLMSRLGLAGSLRIAAMMNVGLGLVMLGVARWKARIS